MKRLYFVLLSYVMFGHIALAALLNVNEASRAELIEKLPQIDIEIIDDIINYRTAHGAFLSINNLLKIDSIDDSTFIQLSKYLQVPQKMIPSKPLIPSQKPSGLSDQERKFLDQNKTRLSAKKWINL